MANQQPARKRPLSEIVLFFNVSARSLRRWVAAGYLPRPSVAAPRGLRSSFWTEQQFRCLQQFLALRASGLSLAELAPQGGRCWWWPDA
jgi:DNA-binding transcriptional MerR regulator